MKAELRIKKLGTGLGILILLASGTLAQRPTTTNEPVTMDPLGHYLPLLKNGHLPDLPAGSTIGGNPIAGGLSSVPVGKTLFVDPNGSDSTGLRGRLDKPFLTLPAAKAQAVSGDLVQVAPGSYATTINLAKNGVNWHFEAGAIVNDTSTGNEAIFDDSVYGAAGAVTFRITGEGQFIRNAGSGNHPRAVALRIVNANSNVTVHADLIQAMGSGVLSDQTSPYAIRQAGGTLNVNARRIAGDYGGIWWDNGECFVTVNEITVITGIPAIYTSTGALGLDEWSAAYVSGFMWVDAQRIHNPSDATLKGDVVITSDSVAPRVWVTVKELAGFFTVGGSAGGRNYLNAQKVRLIGLSSGENWITVQKVQSVGGASLGLSTVSCTGGTNYLSIQNVDHGGSSAIFRAFGGTNYVTGQLWTTGLDRDGILVSNGTTTVEGLTVDVSPASTSKNPIQKLGGTLILKDVRLIANGSRESIFASSAQTVTRAGTIYANNPANVNITLSPAGTDLGDTGGGGGSVALDTIFDAKGDLAVGTGADTAAKLTIGANDTIAIADSSQATGIRWGTPASVRTALGLVTDPAFLFPNAPMGALAVDVTKHNNTKSVSADSTLTFSGPPGTGATFGLTLTNTDSAAHTITIPSSYSLTISGTRTSFPIAAGEKMELSWRYDGTTYFLAGDPGKQADVWAISVSNLTDAITTSSFGYMHAPRAATVTGVKAGLLTASSSGTVTFTIKEAGTTILSTNLTVDATENTSATAAVPAVVSDSAIADNALMRADVTGAGTGAIGGIVYIYVQY